MTLLGLLFVLVVVGVILWAIQQFPAIDGTIKRVIYVVVIVAVVLWIATSLLGGSVHDVRLW